MSATIPQPDGAAVRKTPCTLCSAVAGTPCQRQPAADHLARWLTAYTAGKVTRAELAEVFAQVVILTKWQIVEERAA
jgi:hypothetical protein